MGINEDSGGTNRQGELDTAQGILNAAEITLPTGDLVDGAYDSLGNLYQLPPYVVSAPENMVEDGDPAATRSRRPGNTSGPGATDANPSDPANLSIAREKTNKASLRRRRRISCP